MTAVLLTVYLTCLSPIDFHFIFVVRHQSP
jgi:hypothetical protein